MEFRVADTFTDSLCRLTTDEQKVANTMLKAEIDPEAWATLNGDTSRGKPKTGRIAVKVINYRGDEVMKESLCHEPFPSH